MLTTTIIKRLKKEYKGVDASAPELAKLDELQQEAEGLLAEKKEILAEKQKVISAATAQKNDKSITVEVYRKRKAEIVGESKKRIEENDKKDKEIRAKIERIADKLIDRAPLEYLKHKDSIDRLNHVLCRVRSQDSPRIKLMALNRNYEYSDGFKEIDEEVFADARTDAYLATSEKDEDYVEGMNALLALETPDMVKQALDKDLRHFKERSRLNNSDYEALSESQKKVYDKALEESCLSSLFTMSGTCNGPGSRPEKARRYYTAAFELVKDKNWRLRYEKTKDEAENGEKNPDLGSIGSRFCKLNRMLNHGPNDEDKTGIELRIGAKGEFGEPRNKGEEANVRGIVAKSDENVDGAVRTTPGGDAVKRNMSAISSFVEGYLKERPEDVNPIEILAKQYQAEVTNHPCLNGNGRSALLNLMATARDLDLPMPLLTEAGTKMIHGMGGQIRAEDNASPVDAMAAVAQGMNRMLEAQAAALEAARKIAA